MNGMPADSFVDTNIWVYAHLRKINDPRHPLALSFVKRLKNGVISPQVVAEYYNVMLKNGKDDTWIQANIASMLGFTRMQQLDGVAVQHALAIRNRYGFSYWDCQIVAVALEAGCTELYTEDMQAGQIIEGVLTLVNPLREATDGLTYE
jgi:predicted nucleic acid-binding protein